MSVTMTSPDMGTTSKNGWQEVSLGNLLEKSQAFITLEPLKSYQGVTVRLWGKGAVSRGWLQGSEIAAPRMLPVRPGQFIMSRIDARNGAAAVVPPELDGAVVSNDFPVFTPRRERLLPEYLGWYCKTGAFVDLCKQASEGTTNRVRLKEEGFLAVKISLPPLEEQRRIVARVKELAVKVEEAQHLKQEALAETDVVVDGALGAVYDDLMRSNGLTLLGNLVIDAKYGTSIKCHNESAEGAVAVLRIPNVASEQVNFENLKFGHLTQSEMERVSLLEGDILVVRTNGSADLVGRCAVVPRLEETYAFASYLIRLRVDTGKVLPEYVQLMLKHLRRGGILIDFARTTAGQYNVSLGRLRAAPIPVPTISIQREVMHVFSNLQVKIAALRDIQIMTATELDALLPAILNKAFKGEL